MCFEYGCEFMHLICCLSCSQVHCPNHETFNNVYVHNNGPYYMHVHVYETRQKYNMYSVHVYWKTRQKIQHIHVFLFCLFNIRVYTYMCSCMWLHVYTCTYLYCRAMCPCCLNRVFARQTKRSWVLHSPSNWVFACATKHSGGVQFTVTISDLAVTAHNQFISPLSLCHWVICHFISPLPVIEWSGYGSTHPIHLTSLSLSLNDLAMTAHTQFIFLLPVIEWSGYDSSHPIHLPSPCHWVIWWWQHTPNSSPFSLSLSDLAVAAHTQFISLLPVIEWSGGGSTHPLYLSDVAVAIIIIVDTLNWEV